MEINLKTLTGKLYSLVVTESMQVDEFKGMVYDVTDTHPFDQRIIFAGKVLEDESGRTLGEYNVEDGSTLHLVLKMRGGAVLESGSNLCVLTHDVLEEMQHDWAKFDSRVREYIAKASRE